MSLKQFIRPPKSTHQLADSKPSPSQATEAGSGASSQAVEKPKQGELGVSGTLNYTGRIHAEGNSKLAWEKAYGTPGNQTWGEWETLERTDHAVASALNMLVAPIRDADVLIEAPECEEESADETPEDPTKPSDKPSDKPGEVPPVDDTELAESAGDKAAPTSAGPSVTGPEEIADTEEEDPEAELQEDIASFVKDCLTEWIEPGWPQLLEQMVKGGLAYGFALFEVVWATREDDRVPGGIAYYPSKLAQRLPSSILQDGWREKNGDLDFIKQAGTRDGVWEWGIELPADKCVLATWNRNGNNYAGFSAFRPGWYMAKIRAELLKIVAIGHDREACGIPTVTTEKDVPLTDPQRAALQEILENLRYHENAALALPAGSKLEWIFSPGANKSSVMDTWNRLGIAIMELVQAQQIALGTDGTGSRAVGEVHDGSKNSFVNGIRAWVESVLNGVGNQKGTGLVKQIIDFNFGPQKRYAKFRLVPKLEEDKSTAGQLAWVQAVNTAKQAGALNLTDDDEDFIRQRLGLPEVDEAMRAAKKAKGDELKQAQIDALNNGGLPPTPPGPGGGLPVPPPPPSKTEMADMPFMPRRALRPAEQNVNLAEIASFFDEGRKQFEVRIKDFVNKLVRDAKPRLTEAMADGNPSEVKSLKFDTKAISKAVSTFIDEARLFGYRQAAIEKTRQAKGKAPEAAAATLAPSVGFCDTWLNVFELAFQNRPPNAINAPWRSPDSGVNPQDTPEPELSKATMDMLVEAQTKLVVDRITSRTRGNLWTNLVNGSRRGQSIDDAIDKTLEDIDISGALRADAGLVLSQSFSMGRDEFMAQQGDIQELEYTAILDTSTCDACDAADGDTFAPGSPEAIEHVTPYSECQGRNNCRCMVLAKYK